MNPGTWNGSKEPELPPYAFVPGGPWPHPTGSREGHMGGGPREEVPPITEVGWEHSSPYRYGIILFNSGYYWEAHEAWEAIWHAEGRRGPTADVIKGLIKLAAAGVKVREGQPRGVMTHALRAAALFDSVRSEKGPVRLGLKLDELAATARRIAERPPVDPGRPGDAVVLVFSFRLDPQPGSD